jgi:hypothetical protein
VWTGIEYQVAAHCLREGLIDEGQAILDALWRRYDGRRRNPYNEIECGDHYARALAGWSVIDAMGGVCWDAVSRTLHVRPATVAAVPLVLDGGWGVLNRTENGVVLDCRYGEFDISHVLWAGAGSRDLAPDGVVVSAGTTSTLERD